MYTRVCTGRVTVAESLGKRCHSRVLAETLRKSERTFGTTGRREQEWSQKVQVLGVVQNAGERLERK